MEAKNDSVFKRCKNFFRNNTKLKLRKTKNNQASTDKGEKEQKLNIFSKLLSKSKKVNFKTIFERNNLKMINFKRLNIKKLNLKKFTLKGFTLRGLSGKILTISVGAVVITVVIILSMVIPSIQSYTKDYVEVDQLAMAERLRHAITDYLGQLDRSNENISKTPALRSEEYSSTRIYLSNVAIDDSRINRLSVYDLEGTEQIRTHGRATTAELSESQGFETAKRGESHSTGFYLGATGQPALTISTPIFSNVNNTEVVGVLEVDYSMNTLWSYVYQYNMGETGGAMVIDSSGTVLGHRDNGYVYNSVSMKEDLPWGTMEENFRGNITFNHNDTEYFAAYNQIPGVQWKVVIYQGQGEVLEQKAIIIKNIIKTALMLVLAAVIITLIFVTITFSPLKTLDKGARAIASGDLTQSFNIKSKDEIGDLSRAFESMVVSLKEIIGSSLESAQITENTAKELSMAANEAAMASQQIATTVEEVAKGAEDQTTASQRVVEKVNNIAAMAKDIADRSEMATKINQAMVVTIEDNTKTMVELISALKDIVDGNIRVSGNISSLEKEAQMVGKIITVVTDIAGQTNLLALNAAIEAARAGDAGRGFAVVADEVRKLSDETSKAATEIKKIVQSIQSQISDTAIEVNAQSSKAQGQLLLIDDASKALEAIGETSKTTLEAITEINIKSQQQAQEVEEVVIDSKQVAYVAEQTSASSQEVAATSEQQTASLQEITAATQSLAEVAGELRELVNKFKV